ncbi:hypothetical protein, partial [uncultured Enterococcus sp.]|uniref:hypothetical protein n=1 Tax=uncultured Enterococcus sp. TaxID=167972 RepID=UPI0026298D09
FHHEKSSNLLFEYSITGELDRCDTPRYWALTNVVKYWAKNPAYENLCPILIQKVCRLLVL